MKFWVHYLIVFFLSIVACLPAAADDQQKAQREVSKITAMATDATGRRIVNLTMAEVLKVGRPVLVQERRQMGLNYGSLFMAHVLSASGAKMDAVVARLRSGKNIVQIGNELNANWKQIASEAKSLNKKIEMNLYDHFLHAKAEADRDKADHYELRIDGVRADNDVTDRQVSDAQNTYLFWQDQASQILGRGQHLDTVKERAARMDHMSLGGPQGSGGTSAVGSAPPASGGIGP
jgi:hypothetical protein